MKQLVVLGLLYLGLDVVVCAYGPCVIAPYYRGSWDVVGSEVVLILRRTLVTSVIEGHDRQTLDCVQRKGNIILLQTATNTDGHHGGVVCLLFGEMADAGVTIDRLNPVPMNGSIMDPQTIGADVTMTIDNVCRQTPSGVRTAYIKRKRPGLCRLPVAYRGTWNSTLPGADHIVIKTNSLGIVFAGGFLLVLTCECRDHDVYLLRTKVTFMNNMDGFMCVTIATPPTGEHRVTIIQTGQFWNGVLATVPHLQPLLLARDCPIETTSGKDVILYRD